MKGLEKSKSDDNRLTKENAKIKAIELIYN